MITECPNCNQSLRFSDQHKAKINAALGKLPQGRTLKFGCPKCKESIELNKNGEVINKTVTDASPQSMRTSSLNPHSPPGPPDIGWLAQGKSIDTDTVKNIPTAMVIIPDETRRTVVVEALKEKDYQIVIPGSIDEAIDSMRFKDYAIVVYHSDAEPKPVNSQDFHKFMKQMGMVNRRYIYYILIGTDFKTLYDLEALTYSANLVVNDGEIQYMSTLLTKGLADYEELFEQYLSILKVHGKK